MGPRGLMAAGASLSAADLLELLGEPHVGSIPPAGIQSFNCDDRLSPATLFIAIRGSHHDSSVSIAGRIDAGVRCIVAERTPQQCDGTRVMELQASGELVWWQVEDARLALARMAHRAAGSPSCELQVFGITGTNGKSTTVKYLARILEEAGREVGWSTTVEKRIGSSIVSSSMTTPGPFELNDAMARHLQAGGTDFVVEVSSHAIDQQRIGGVSLQGAAITSLGRDHLDYHRTLEEYHRTKQKLRDFCRQDAPFLVPCGEWQQGQHPAFEIVTGESRSEIAEAIPVTSSLAGIEARIRTPGFDGVIRIPQPGLHNLSNALVAVALAASAGISEEDIRRGIEGSETVSGRLQRVPVESPSVYIDFAHTPDALCAVISAMRPLVAGKLLLLFGCGGDRDQGKRAEMGREASCADHLFITSDNPRGEDPVQIIEQIVQGVATATPYTVEADRRTAMSLALEMVGDDDVLIVAGKGHEQTQQIAGETLPFDDMTVVEELICHQREGGVAR